MQWLNGLAWMRATPGPAGIPRARWTKIIATAGTLLERWGSQLAALGWTAADVFGADRALAQPVRGKGNGLAPSEALKRAPS
jgi:hypothetical protein